MKIYRRFVDFTSKTSLNYRLRQARLKMFLAHIDDLKRPVRILDVGGSSFYWEHLFFDLPGVRREDYEITITNIEDEQMKREHGGDDYYRYAKLDARDMREFGNEAFDVVHSNSVIEHVGDFEDMMRMASEVRRVGRRHFLQTPNFWFPIEPHFRAFFWHWLPRSLRISVMQRRAVGHLPRATSQDDAVRIVDSARLLSHRQMKLLFPASTINREKFLGLTKSFIVVG